LEENMKRIMFAILLTTAFITGVAMAQNKKAAAPGNERAVVQFTQTVLVNGVFLKGDYLVIHDEARMANGENCTYIYEYTNKEQGRLVTSFHCTPVERERVGEFTILVAPIVQSPGGIRRVTAIQFAGSTEAHQLPAD
jgi:hypothetical protein